MKNFLAITVQHGLEKSPASRQTGIGSQFCLTANSLEINLQAGHPIRVPSKAFRNLALCAAAIPDSPANRGLYSSRAVAISWPRFPATSLFSHAVSSPAGRPNSLGYPSRTMTVMRTFRRSVFAHTQSSQNIFIFGLVFFGNVPKNLSEMNWKPIGAKNCPRIGRRQRASKSFDRHLQKRTVS